MAGMVAHLEEWDASIMRRLIFAAALLTAAPAVAAGPLSVPLDEVRVVAFAKPVATLYIGNPVIADVTIIDSRHAFVQAKSFGATNVVALDANGRQIANQQIVVAGKSSSMVTLQKGAQQTTYSCTGQRCQPTPQPGDGKDAFDAATSQIDRYQGMLSKAASGGGQ
jgi:Flp pilus assembly protein, secretin CpaC